MANELRGGDTDLFKYEQLDGDTAEFLRKKEWGIKTKENRIVGDLIEIGRDLYETQQELANNYRGVFEKWYTSIGYERQNVYNLISRYKLILADCENIGKVEVIEQMPITVLREITKKDAESTPEKAQAKAEVLAGEIDTGKAYKERIKQLERERDAEQSERERLESENEKLSARESEVRVEYETRTEYVEVKDEFSEKRAEEAETRLREYEERFGDIRNYDDKITASNRQDMIVAVSSFTRGVRDFAKRYSYLAQYTNVITNLDNVHKESYDESVRALRDLANTFKEVDGEVFIINQ